MEDEIGRNFSWYNDKDPRSAMIKKLIVDVLYEKFFSLLGIPPVNGQRPRKPNQENP